ncbi:ROK family protein [Ruminiclostridium josui]|uniref:ROK family protein n=1 Tax=Ruminiclostridium josui TaxID=1499 RepID=UPI000464D93E|nr:ROK family protein [Ruminiclostridium josui]
MIDNNIFSGLSSESKKIFSLILHIRASTKGTLSEISDIKLTSLNRMMQPLEEMELLVKAETGESTGGRKPVLYDVNPSGYYIIGIDISRTYTQIVLTNLKMKPIKKFRFDMNKESTPKLVLSKILSWIKDVNSKLKKENGTIIGVGIGTVGPIDKKRGLILNPENFLAPGWENIPLKSIFEKRLGVPVEVDNGANAAVLAETNFGIAKGIKNVIYINCGIGIRMGIIASGLFVRNINDAEDAFAHMVVDANGMKCSCGNKGCIEAYSSIYSLVERFKNLNKKTDSEIIQDEITYVEICKAAERMETPAVDVITYAAKFMGEGLANLIKLLNPGIVILSGPLIINSQLFYDLCTDIAYKKSHLQKDGRVIFNRGGQFNEIAIAIGASAMVLEKFLGNEL